MSFVDDDLAEVVRRERDLLDPAVRARPDLLEALLHPDFVEHGASGQVWDRAAVIDALGQAPDLSGEPHDFLPSRLAQDVVLLTYRLSGDPGSLRSSVWVRDATGWLLRFHQGTNDRSG